MQKNGQMWIKFIGFCCFSSGSIVNEKTYKKHDDVTFVGWISRPGHLCGTAAIH